MSLHQTAEVGYVLRRFPVLSEAFVLNELLALEERGVPLTVFSLYRPNEFRFNEELSRLRARVTYVPDLTEPGTLLRQATRARKRFGPVYWKALRWVLSRKRPTLLWRFMQATYVANEAQRMGLKHLHAQFANSPTTVTQLASRLSGIPFSFAAHGTDIFRTTVDQRALWEKVRNARWVVTGNEFNREYLLGVSGAAPAKVLVVRNGVRLDDFTPADPPPKPPFRMVCVARLVEKRGLPVLIDACTRLKEWGVDFELGIIGKGSLRPRLQTAIRRRRLEDHVRLLGPQTHGEVLQRYRESHLFVLSAVVERDGSHEGLPVSIVEALACGLPVVSTSIAGIPEAVRHGHNGLLVPPGDPGALAAALESVIRRPWLYERLRANARASVMDNFDLLPVAATLDRLLAESCSVPPETVEDAPAEVALPDGPPPEVAREESPAEDRQPAGHAAAEVLQDSPWAPARNPWRLRSGGGPRRP